MKKLLLLSAALTLIGGISSAVIASDKNDDHGAEKVQHYEGKAFETPELAAKSLNNDNAKIADILKADKLTDAQLEQIHQISYGLEDAIDTLIAKKAGDKTKLETIDEAVQAIHHASENHKEAEVREWFAKLEPAAGDINAADKEAKAAADNVYELRIKDHTFTPAELRVPAGQKIKLIVYNDDPTPEEFESDDFRREKIIAGNSKATIHVGPLKPGKYHFFGEFNLDKANGYLYAE